MSTILASIFVFLLVITLHEFGHFAAAKSVGIKVNEFAVGMGPKLFSKRKGETLYSLRALPIGGFCAMEGEEQDSPDPRSFQKASLFHRFIVVIAGAGMNFILAIIAFFIFSLLIGTQTTTIDRVIPDSPAKIAGLEKGDQIVAINNKNVKSWGDIIEGIGSENKVLVKVQRGEEYLSYTIPTKTEDGRRIIGISSQVERNPVKSFQFSLRITGEVIGSIFMVFKMMFQRTLKTEMLAGPVGVVSMIGQSSKEGIPPLLFILGLISANLGVVNLLPIPALDGGKLLFLAIEGIRGKPVPEEKEGLITIIGMAFLLSIMIYITIFGDLKRLITG
ncbi:MAG: RIP metalloprotease RseP [Tissierellia bacterium]|nr:RIP metalloprotease RseP [Tissierellia bacterium]